MNTLNSPPLLLPAPRKLDLLPGTCRLPDGAELSLHAPDGAQSLLATAQELARMLATVGMPVALTGQELPNAAVRLQIAPELFPGPDSYRISIQPAQIQIMSADFAGAWYAVMTLRQLCRQLPCGAPLPCLLIDDAPDFPHRGVMLDVSRDKVPTLATLKLLAERLAELKINQLQLYTEHTFAYRNHRAVWEHASPLTAADILELDAYCRALHIELVPNQNSFGHLERWLKHPAYLPLAASPEGCDLPWGGHRDQPSGLNPEDPRSLALIRELYDELLPNFSSRQCNVGCDETFDLGFGRTAAACQARGKGRVYLDFLLKIHGELRNRGCVMQFWGDIILHYPELIAELPPDLVALVWGYEANHPFAEQCARFAAAGLRFYVCPGTSSWRSIAGRTANALANLRAAAEHGLAHGACGYLNTDWGDGGHWQPYATALLPYAYGAAVAWHVAGNQDLDIARATSLHLFQDRAKLLGQIAYDLGNASRDLGNHVDNRATLFAILHYADSPTLFAEPALAAITAAQLAARSAEIATITERLNHADSAALDGASLTAELRHAAAMLQLACDLGAARLRQSDKQLASVPATERATLAARRDEIVATHRHQWLIRNRPGGLDDSAKHLEKLNLLPLRRCP